MSEDTREKKKVKPKKTEEQLTLEEKMNRLEEVVDALGKPGTDLGEALAMYKEGVTLADACLAELEGVEKELRILEVSEEGGEDDPR